MSRLNWFLMAILISLGMQHSAIAKGAKKNRSILLLALDGIGYDTILKMFDGGYFRQFQRPIPMVASFPSISDPNWAHIMNAPLENSYTKGHFELSKNPDGSFGKEVGNIMKHLTTSTHYEEKFDFKAEGFLQHLATMAWSETTTLYWTDAISRKLLDSNNLPPKIYKAFIVSTDIVSHTHGEKQVLEYLKALDRRLKKLQKSFKEKYKRPLDIVMVSDHGNFFQKPKAIEFEETLKKNGFQLKKILRDKSDYAFVASEIIAFGAFYTLPGQELLLARAFKKVPHIHVALAKEKENVIHVYSAIGESLITINPIKKTVSYKILLGSDPFHQIDLFKKSKKLSWNDYFYKTLDSKYPNALVRAWEGFYKNAKMPASVLVSPELGYAFTNPTLELLTAISGVHSTHGSFDRKETMGIVFSTMPTNKEAITPFEFLELFKSIQN